MSSTENKGQCADDPQQECGGPPTDDEAGPQHVADASSGPLSGDLHALIEVAVARQNDVLIITAVEGRNDRIVYANPAIERHSGYSVEDVIGKTPKMFQGPKTSRDTLDQIRMALDSGLPVRAELLNYGKNGGSYWTEIDITPILDDSGSATHMVSVQRAITARKNAQNALRRCDERFRLALKANANAVWEWTIATGEVEYRDEKAGLSWRGRHHGNRLGEGLDVLFDLVHPDDLDRVRQTMLARIKGNDQLGIVEYRLRRPDGSYANVSDRQFILRDADGKAERLIGSILDVSEEVQNKNRRHQAQRLELLGEMTGGVAHNFNNLLTVILGNADRLRQDHLNGKVNLDTIRLIDEAAQRGAKLTEDLMSFSNKGPLILASVDIKRLIDQAIPVWSNLLSPKISLHVRPDAALWPATTDTTHLEAALLNIVINARDAMPAGGKLLVEAENVPIGSKFLREGESEQPKRYVLITVTDDGTGMPAEHLKLAFDPFFTTKSPVEGTGLGLSSAHGFLQQSGGFIRLESTLGKGTTVRVFLQAADEIPEPEIARPSRDTQSDGGHCVLVVEDDPMVRDFVQAVLKSLKYKVIACASGNEALQMLGSGSNVDLLFTDILLDNGMNGWELASRVRALFPDLPVLFTSAYPDSVKPPSETWIGTINLLRKPYRIRDMSVAIRTAIADEK